MNGAFRSRARTSVISGNQDNLGACLCNAGGYRAHAGLGNQFDRDVGVLIGIFQIVNQLRQVLNGVNIVVGRRRIRLTPGVECLVLAIQG